jgi:hypothetical protein
MSLGEGLWLGALAAAISYGVYLIAKKEQEREARGQERSDICSSILAREEDGSRFTKKELVDYGELEKDMDSCIDKLSSGELEKIGAIKDDKLGVVMIPIDKYERMVEMCRLAQESRSK